MQDLLTTTWKMEKAASKIKREKKKRMDIIREKKDSECIEECSGNWFRCALEVLYSNNVEPVAFAIAMRELLTKGRGKFRNILIIGPANCGKTFLLSPLQQIFHTFSNPANDKYAWLGAENAEIIFLNYFRWSSEMIAWKELLLLLEGQTVHLPSPKNHYSNDICINKDTPIVATSKNEIHYVGKYNTFDPTENEKMSIRWKLFKFYKQIAQSEQVELKPCPKCFCKLVLLGAE